MDKATGNMNGRRSGYTGTRRDISSDAASYSVTEHDGGALVRMTADAGIQSIPLGATVGPGFYVDFVASGGSTVRFTSTGPEVTVNSRGNRYDIAGQHGVARAECIGPGEWVVSGDLVSGG